MKKLKFYHGSTGDGLVNIFAFAYSKKKAIKIIQKEYDNEYVGETEQEGFDEEFYFDNESVKRVKAKEGVYASFEIN